ncbi:MAG: DsrE/DsrF/DrsH-like family protein [Deltaproteobacteria bacterium]|nr:DsrE/DsrF/DrsH-like family protein [Deltaproteobacteria bacterium]
MTIQKDNAGSVTLVLFSGELDKAMAAFIIATSAASMGMKVNIFFTFWGLNILKKDKARFAGFNIMQRMMNFMNFGTARKLAMTKMNMAGAGPAMLKMMMGQKKVPTLPAFIKMAHEMGVKFYPCEMSMKVMGLTKEDFIDECSEVIGAVSYLSEAKDSNVNLFI